VFPDVAENVPGTSDREEVQEKETIAFLRDYFQLDVDLQELYDDWSRRDLVFCSFRERFSGIRMLRQDPWENVVS
jgi:N-glycosylase/DNA lyase